MEKLELKNLFIEDVKFGEAEGGMACGPEFGTFVTSLKLRKEDKKAIYLLVTEFDSFCTFMLSEDDYFDKWINENNEDVNEMNDILTKTEIKKIGKLDLCSEYSDLYDNIYSKNLQDTEEGKLIRYIVLVTRCSYDDLEKNIKLGKGHFVKDLELPLSEDEQMYLEEMEESNQ